MEACNIEDSIFAKQIIDIYSQFVLVTGRLEISMVDGMGDTGKYVEFVSYGTRSFSMYKIEGDQLTRVYDR